MTNGWEANLDPDDSGADVFHTCSSCFSVEADDSGEKALDSCSASLLITLELPALHAQTHLCCTLKPGRQECVWDNVEELVQGILMDSDEFSSVGSGCCLEKLDELRKQAASDVEEWHAKLRLADDWKRKVDNAGEQMNKMRSSYYKELLHLKEQLYRRQQSEDKGDTSWLPTYVSHFDPSEYHMDDEVARLASAKVQFIQQEYEFKKNELELRLESLQESLDTAQMMLEQYRKKAEADKSKKETDMYSQCDNAHTGPAEKITERTAADEQPPSVPVEVCSPRSNSTGRPTKSSSACNAGQRWSKVRNVVAATSRFKNQKQPGKSAVAPDSPRKMSAVGSMREVCSVRDVCSVREVGTDPIPFERTLRKVPLTSRACQSNLDAQLLEKAMEILNKLEANEKKEFSEILSAESQDAAVHLQTKSRDTMNQEVQCCCCPELSLKLPLKQRLPTDSDPVDKQVRQLEEMASDIDRMLPLMMTQAQKLRHESGCESAHRLILQIAKFLSAGSDQRVSAAPTPSNISYKSIIGGNIAAGVEEVLLRHGIPVDEHGEQERPESANNACGTPATNSMRGLVGEAARRSRRAWGSVAQAHRICPTPDRLGNLVADLNPAVAEKIRRRSYSERTEHASDVFSKCTDVLTLQSPQSDSLADSPVEFFPKPPYQTPTAKTRVDTATSIATSVGSATSIDSEEEDQVERVASSDSWTEKPAKQPYDLRRGVAKLLRQAAPSKLKTGLSSNSLEDASPRSPEKLPSIPKRQQWAVDAPPLACRAPESCQDAGAGVAAKDDAPRRLSTGSLRASTQGELKSFSSEDRRNSCPSVDLSYSRICSNPAALSMLDAPEQQTSALAVVGQGQSPPTTPRSIQQPAGLPPAQPRPGAFRNERTRYFSAT